MLYLATVFDKLLFPPTFVQLCEKNNFLPTTCWYNSWVFVLPFRFCIKVCPTLSIPARVTREELTFVYDDKVTGLSTVEQWSKLFRAGREEIEDKVRPDRPG